MDFGIHSIGVTTEVRKKSNIGFVLFSSSFLLPTALLFFHKWIPALFSLNARFSNSNFLKATFFHFFIFALAPELALSLFTRFVLLIAHTKVYFANTNTPTTTLLVRFTKLFRNFYCPTFKSPALERKANRPLNSTALTRPILSTTSQAQ